MVFVAPPQHLRVKGEDYLTTHGHVSMWNGNDFESVANEAIGAYINPTVSSQNRPIAPPEAKRVKGMNYTRPHGKVSSWTGKTWRYTNEQRAAARLLVLEKTPCHRRNETIWVDRSSISVNESTTR